MPSKPAPPSRSTAVEDYLEQILDLINTKGDARVADIAQDLRISQASVTNMVQRQNPKLVARIRSRAQGS
jgi:Mn-dependent DtxR family transcriptional regulator